MTRWGHIQLIHLSHTHNVSFIGQKRKQQENARWRMPLCLELSSTFSYKQCHECLSLPIPSNDTDNAWVNQFISHIHSQIIICLTLKSTRHTCSVKSITNKVSMVKTSLTAGEKKSRKSSLEAYRQETEKGTEYGRPEKEFSSKCLHGRIGVTQMDADVEAIWFNDWWWQLFS